MLKRKDKRDKIYFKSHIVKRYIISSNELVQATYKINNKYNSKNKQVGWQEVNMKCKKNIKDYIEKYL